jgi:hypothetical protein
MAPEPPVTMVLHRLLSLIRAGQCQTNSICKHPMSEPRKQTNNSHGLELHGHSVQCCALLSHTRRIMATHPSYYAGEFCEACTASRTRCLPPWLSSHHGVDPGLLPYHDEVPNLSEVNCEAFNWARPARDWTLQHPSCQGPKDRLQSTLSPGGEFSLPAFDRDPTQLGRARYSQSR